MGAWISVWDARLWWGPDDRGDYHPDGADTDMSDMSKDEIEQSFGPLVQVEVPEPTVSVASPTERPTPMARVCRSCSAKNQTIAELRAELAVVKGQLERIQTCR